MEVELISFNLCLFVRHSVSTLRRERLGNYRVIAGALPLHTLTGVTTLAAPFAAAVEQSLPWSDSVYDRFYVMEQYGCVIDQVRRSEFKKAAKEDKTILRAVVICCSKTRTGSRETRNQAGCITGVQRAAQCCLRPERTAPAALEQPKQPRRYGAAAGCLV